MKLPVFAMWNDESIALPNRAGRELLQQDVDPMTKEGYDFASRCTLFTEDFSRRLEPDEYPIVQLCRTQKSFTCKKVGIKHPKTGKHINFDVSGDGIYDEKTGEFLAGLVWFRDVTEYTDRIAIQNEQNEARFQTMCDSMPQMVSLTRFDLLSAKFFLALDHNTRRSTRYVWTSVTAFPSLTVEQTIFLPVGMIILGLQPSSPWAWAGSFHFIPMICWNL